MYKLIALILILAGVGLAVMGITTYQDATAGVSFLGLDLSVSDQEAKQTAILYIAGAVFCLLSGFAIFRRS